MSNTRGIELKDLIIIPLSLAFIGATIHAFVWENEYLLIFSGICFLPFLVFATLVLVIAPYWSTGNYLEKKLPEFRGRMVLIRCAGFAASTAVFLILFSPFLR